MFAIAALAGLLGLSGVIWIAVIAFQNGDVVWGIFSIFCGLAALIYGLQHYDQTKIPLGLLVAGAALSAVGRLMTTVASY